MKTFTRFLLFALLLAVMPLKNWAQTPYRQYADEGILLNAYEIDNVGFRVFLLYSLHQDDRFDVIADEEPGQFSIVPGHDGNVVNFMDAFESAYQSAHANFSLYTKPEIEDLMTIWKCNIPSKHYMSLTLDIALRNSRPSNNHCADSDPFCTSDLITFDAAATSQTADQLEGVTLEDGCIGSSYNPSWYHMRIQTGGQFIIHVEGHDPTTPSTTRDVDFCMWGPYTDPTSPCVAQLTSDKIIDCSFSAHYTEDIFLGYPDADHYHGSTGTTSHGTIYYHVPVPGEYYILMITNFSQQPCTISFTKTEGSGPGTTDCGILPGIVNNDGPYCVGETINLTVNQQAGATYTWTGPNGYTATGISPSRPNCTLNMAGTYTCVTHVGTQTSSASTEVVIYPQPTANFTNTTVCVGNATQFTSTSTTNPTGQSIGSYQWNFGDESTGTGANPTHTYTNPGTYQVTLTVSTGNGHCTDQITKTVTVNALPTASFNATTVCQGQATQFTSTSTGQGISNYQWNFGDGSTGSGQNTTHTFAQPGTHQVTLTVQTSGGCTDQVTQTVTVNAQPTASFNATTVCEGEATQFTSTSTGGNSFQWNFGDSQTGTGQSANHTYAHAGTYQATLTVQSEGGCTDQITQTVVVNALPTANFTATNVCQGSPMQFTSTSTGDQINSYQWTFGDGQNGTGQTASHNYTSAGSYPVTLTVQTAGGCTDTYTQNVEVYAMPVASASAQPSTVIYGANATLTANAGAQGVFSFHWEPANLVVNPDAQTTQTVALQETQTFTVTITNPQGGCTSTAQVIVSIDGSSLLAMATADQTDLCDGESTTLHAIPSGGAPENYTYQWSPAGTLNNATSQNPVASPALGNTTYTCHVSDGFTDIDVSVTLHVHPNVEHDIYQTICDNDTYSYFGEDIHTPGIYDHTLHTQFGCDSIVHLHLDNWQTYETPVSDHFCQGEQYDFLGEGISAPGTYYHTLNSAHGCDSVIRLNLLQDPKYEFDLWESTCQGGPGYYFAGQYYQPNPNAYIFNYETHQGCDSTIYLHVEESQYNSKNYNISLCGTEYTWPSNGVTYYESGVYYDTLHYANTCDSTLILNLEIRPNYSDEVVVSSCDTYRWKNDNFNVDMTFTESTVYTHHYTNAFGCPSEATLYLTISSHDEYDFVVPEDEACDEYFWDPMGHEIVYTDHDGLVYDMSGTYHRTYTNAADCDSLVTMRIQLEYTPHPTPIYPMDANNTAPHWVVTASEFQINTYDFNLWDTNPNCYWDTVTWTCVGAPDWIIEPFGAKGKCCKVYVLNRVEDTVWLTAHAFNRCAPDEGVMQRYWMVCSYYGLDELTNADFSVVPNPNNGQMKLNFDNLTGKINVKVYDMKGALIDDFETYNNTTAGSYTYQMKSRSDGIYFFVASGKEGTIAKKVIIQR